MTNVREVVRFSRIATNGIHLFVAEAGPSDGPLVFLLHGFPEFWYGWRNQIAPLAERGFHVVVPDQRGYNLSDKPKGATSYDLDHLASDVVGLADYFGHHWFAVVGHDWGGAVGWWLAGRHASRVRQLAVLNAPHPAVWLHAIHHDPAQKRKSAYVRFFQVPYLPEALIALNRFEALAKGFRDSIRPDAFTKADLEQYRKAWAQPGALTATINYYRALLKNPPSPPARTTGLPARLWWSGGSVMPMPYLSLQRRVSGSVSMAGSRIWIDRLIGCSMMNLAASQTFLQASSDSA